jgi:hypothetical protein
MTTLHEYTSFVDVLRKKIRDDMNNYADDIAGDACADFPSYKKLCGVIQGLAIAERHLIDLAEKATKDDYDE